MNDPIQAVQVESLSPGNPGSRFAHNPTFPVDGAFIQSIGGQFGNMSNGRWRTMQEFRMANPLPVNSQINIDREITETGLSRNNLGALLVRRGLVRPLPEWMRILSLTRQRVSRNGAAHRSMVPEQTAERFRVDFLGDTWPVYMTWSPFDFNIREEQAADFNGIGLDSAHIAAASEAINASVEHQGVFGLTNFDLTGPMTISGLSAPGLTSTTTTFSYPSWLTGGVGGIPLNGKEITDILRGAIQQLRDTKHRGPLALLLPEDYEFLISDEYNANHEKTILEHLSKLFAEIEVVEALPAGSIAIVELSKNSVELLNGQTNVPISWLAEPGFIRKFLVVACQVIRWFPDYDGKYGVAYGTEE